MRARAALAEAGVEAVAGLGAVLEERAGRHGAFCAGHAGATFSRIGGSGKAKQRCGKCGCEGGWGDGAGDGLVDVLHEEKREAVERVG